MADSPIPAQRGRRSAEAATLSPIPAQRGRRSAVPVAPLGSLTQRSQRSDAICSVCGSDHVTQLSMNLTDGTPVEFTSCHGCEHRTWSRSGGDVIAVDDVLEHARKR